MAGRPRKPTRLKILKGSFNVTRDREARKNEPNVHEVRVPDPPDYLSEHQKWAWEKFRSVLEPNRVTTAEDFAVLEQLACVYSEMVLLRQAIREEMRKNGDEAMTYEVVFKSGVERRMMPEMNALQDVDRRLVLLLGKFGLTPSDRSKVSMMGGASSGDPHDEFAKDPA